MAYPLDYLLTKKRISLICYNEIKLSKDTIVCNRFAEQLLGAGVKSIQSETFHF